MRRTVSTVVITALVLLAGCSKQKPVAVTAQELCSQASFAMQQNDNANAASLLRQATELKPDFAEAWVGLGMAEVQLSQIEKARSAYGRALALHSERYKRTQSPNELQQQAFVLLLLGRSDDAESLLAKGKQKHANSPTLQEFADNFPQLAGSELQKSQIPKE